MNSNMSHSICWDCKNATGGCSWADVLKPVEGWTAQETVKDDDVSYLVKDCPKFVRDAKGFGLFRLSEENRIWLL